MSIEFLKPILEPLLEKEGVSLERPRTLAKSIERLSHFYRDGGETPWEKSWSRIAGLSYYLPLSVARLQWVLREAEKFKFFQGIDEVIDLGSGLGAFSLALENQSLPLKRALFMEPHKEARRIHQSFIAKLPHSPSSSWVKYLPRSLSHSAVLCSYSFQEMADLPQGIENAEALIIIEPATFEASRRVQSLRQTLIEKGYFVWAPCVHQSTCPLLTNSRKDWCHVGQPVKWPSWWINLERELPMKNRRLEFSYLLMRKTAPIALDSVARVTSQELSTKGKSQVWICRGPQKESLSWLDRNRLEFNLSRGDLIQLGLIQDTRVMDQGSIHKLSQDAMMPSS